MTKQEIFDRVKITDKTPPKSYRWRWWAIVILVVANVLVWQAIWQSRPSGELTISFFNVGQGDAIFIESPTGNQVLIDGGPPGRLAAPLAKAMPWYDRSIDLVIVTHPDTDHVGGLPMVFERYRVANFMAPGVKGDTGVAREVEYRVAKEGARAVLARRGQTIDLGGGAVLQILFPDRELVGGDTNDASIIAKLVYGSTSAMLTGDASEKVEKYLVTLGATTLDSDILKLGHHGSKTSSSEEFLRAVSPELAIVSAGLNNRYGHPHAEVTERLKVLNIPYRETESFAKSKTITLVSDGLRFVER